MRYSSAMTTSSGNVHFPVGGVCTMREDGGGEAPGCEGLAWTSVVLAAFEGNEIPKGVRQFGSKGVEAEGLGNIKARGFGGGDVGERRQCGNRLADMFPAQRALVAIVIGRIGTFRDALDTGDFLDRATVLGGYVRTQDAS